MSTSAKRWGWQQELLCRNSVDNVELPGGQIYHFRLFQIKKGFVLLWNVYLNLNFSMIAVIYQNTLHTHTHAIPLISSTTTISSVFLLSAIFSISSSLGPSVALLQFPLI